MKRKSLSKRIGESRINYYSDLFIVAMVTLWIADSVWQTIIATAVTVSSIVLSFFNGSTEIDTSMWATIGSNIVLPLSSGGALWMIKNAIQHAIAGGRGEKCDYDFPDVEQESQS